MLLFEKRQYDDGNCFIADLVNKDARVHLFKLRKLDKYENVCILSSNSRSQDGSYAACSSGPRPHLVKKFLLSAENATPASGLGMSYGLYALSDTEHSVVSFNHDSA